MRVRDGDSAVGVAQPIAADGGAAYMRFGKRAAAGPGETWEATAETWREAVEKVGI